MRDTKRSIPQGQKNERGEYVKNDTLSEVPDVSIDRLLKEGLWNIKKIMDSISAYTGMSGIPDRALVQSLKDCLQMLTDLKKAEQDLLQDISEEDLQKIAQGK